MRVTHVIPIAAVMLALAACNGGDDEATLTATPLSPIVTTATPGPTAALPEGACAKTVPRTGVANLFPNPGFEEGHDPWFALKPPDFGVSQEVARSGLASARLELREPAGPKDNKIIYLVQELAPAEFPEVISGYYHVENWLKGTPKQYLQFVVIAVRSDNLPREINGSPVNNHQIRFLLAGIDEQPFPISNAHFVFVTEEEPVTDQWVRFERNVKEDFERLWGAAPEGFLCLRLLFEVRFDGKVEGEGPAEADVYYDDLYMGAAPE